jgi:hypothetical protein
MKTRPTPALVAAVITVLGLVAGLTTASTAQADDPVARGAATRFTTIQWPDSPAVYQTPAYVTGKIGGTKVRKRVVLLEQLLPSGWQRIDKDKTNRTGRFQLKAKTSWYHKRLKLRVVVEPTRTASGNTSKGHGFTVKPTYVPRGNPSAWTRIAPGYKIQFNACAPVRWKINTGEAPNSVKPEVKAALKQLGAATGIRFVYTGKTHAIPGSRRAWPRNTNMVVAWARPSQTKWDLHGGTIGRGGQLRTAAARTATGQRAFRITRSGLVLDSTFSAPPGFAGPNARGSILVHELGHVVGLGHASQQIQQMYPSAVNLADGVYQAGDLAGLRHVGLMTGCLKPVHRFGRTLPGYVPPPEAVLADRS